MPQAITSSHGQVLLGATKSYVDKYIHTSWSLWRWIVYIFYSIANSMHFFGCTHQPIRNAYCFDCTQLPIPWFQMLFTCDFDMDQLISQGFLFKIKF